MLTYVIVCYIDTCLCLIRSVGIAYATEQLETNAASLRELPDIEKRKRQRNKKEAIKLLGKDVAALRKRSQLLEKGAGDTVKKVPVIQEPPPRRPKSQVMVIQTSINLEIRYEGGVMAKPIYLIGGRKGGVGKSIVSMALVDYLYEMGTDVLLIDSDTSNPDVGRAYQDSVETKLLDLDVNDGWITLINSCADRPDKTVVINGAARDGHGVRKYGQMLNDSLPELKRRLVTLWVINRQRDSLEMLEDFMAEISQSAVHILRNGYFGETEKFELYNHSELRKRIEGRGGKSVTFPDLGDRVSDAIYSESMSIAGAMKELPIGNRAELARWRGEIRKTLEELIKRVVIDKSNKTGKP